MIIAPEGGLKFKYAVVEGTGSDVGPMGIGADVLHEGMAYLQVLSVALPADVAVHVLGAWLGDQLNQMASTNYESSSSYSRTFF